MRVLVGLGNPGEEYVATRHNAGFWLLDRLVDRLDGDFSAGKGGEVAEVRVDAEKVLLFKPMQYMNRSGEPLQALLSYFKVPLSDVLVAADDVYIEPGSARIRRGGSDGGHNGLKSIIQQLGPDFLRLRIGVGLYEQHPLRRVRQPSLDQYVLQPPPLSDAEKVGHLIDTVTPKLVEWLRSGELEETTVHAI